MSEIKELSFIDEIKELAAMPETSTNLMAMLQDGNRSPDEIANQINLDPALASFLLKTSNSVFYGIKQEIRSIQAAVKMLGLPEVRSILLTYIMRYLYSSSDKTHVMEFLWEHSVSVAVFAKELAAYLEIPEDGAYLAGLLHDIGKLVIQLHAPDEYEKIIKKVDEKGENCSALEEEVFGFTHIQTGYYLANKWGLSDFIKNTILFHHYFISYAGDDPAIGIVAFANQLVHRYIYRQPVLMDVFRRQYNLSPEEVESFAEKTIGTTAQYLSMLTLDPSKQKINIPAIKEQIVPPKKKPTSFAGISASSPPKPESVPKETIVPAGMSPGTFTEGVKLFIQLEKLKKELFELKKTYYLFDYVPLQVLQNHGKILELFSESVNILLKDPQMSEKLNLSTIARFRSKRKPDD
jgi:putative nucleotidyltransferase with HDIG domain